MSRTKITDLTEAECRQLAMDTGRVVRGKLTRSIGPYWLPSGEKRYRVVHKRAGTKGNLSTVGAAGKWLRDELNKLDQGTHVAAADARTTFGPYAEDWLANFEMGIGTDHKPRPSTVARHRSTLDNHLLPYFGTRQFRELNLRLVVKWLRHMRSKPAPTRSGKLSQATVAKGYRLLKQMLTSAVQDHYLSGNPCAVKGAATEPKPDESKYEDLDPDLVRRLAEHMRDETWWEARPTKANPDRKVRRNRRHAKYRALVLLAGLEGPRWGECIALQRRHVDLEDGTVRIRQQVTEVNGTLKFERYTKTDAGMRTIHLTGETVEALRHHLTTHAPDHPNALLWAARPRGAVDHGYLRRGNWRRSVWLPALTALNLDEEDELASLVFHDLRHAAGMLASGDGAPLKDVMRHLGHRSERAALRYQHASETGQVELARRRDATLAKSRAEAATGTDNVRPFRKPTT